MEGSEGFLGGKSSSTSSSCLREARWYWCWGVEGRDGGDVDGDVVWRHDGELVDHIANLWREGVQAAVWLFDCSDAAGF